MSAAPLARPVAFLLAALALAVPGRAAAQEGDLEAELGPRVEELERRFLQRVGEALSLDEEGRRRLGETLSRTREERRRNAERRRATRAELVEAATAARPDEARVARLLDEWSEIQLREAEIFRDEQRRLAEFLTPVERARLVYLRQRFVQAAVERFRGGRGGVGDRRRPRRRRIGERGVVPARP